MHRGAPTDPAEQPIKIATKSTVAPRKQKASVHDLNC
jgi:hypothetical protein